MKKYWQSTLWHALLLPQIALIFIPVWDQSRIIAHQLRHGGTHSNGTCFPDHILITAPILLIIAGALYATIRMLTFSLTAAAFYWVFAAFALLELASIWSWGARVASSASILMMAYTGFVLLTGIFSATVFRSRFKVPATDESRKTSEPEPIKVRRFSFPAKPNMNLPELLVLVAIVAILVAVIIPPAKRASIRWARAMDENNARRIVVASLIYADDHREKLPPRFGLDANGGSDAGTRDPTPHIHALAGALARSGGLNDASVWFSTLERADAEGDLTVLSNQSSEKLHPVFLSMKPSFQYVAGVTTGMPFSTPVVFTRGLGTDGQWLGDENVSVFGQLGGNIAFLDGSIRRFMTYLPREPRWWDWRQRQRWAELDPGPRVDLMNTETKPTANILETISPDQAIYSLPATPTGTPSGLPGRGTPFPSRDP